MIWTFRLGPQKTKCIIVIGGKASDEVSQEIGLILKAVPSERPAYKFGLGTVWIASGQLISLQCKKLVINCEIEESGMMQTERLSDLFVGVSRHPSLLMNLKQQAGQVLMTAKHQIGKR